MQAEIFDFVNPRNWIVILHDLGFDLQMWLLDFSVDRAQSHISLCALQNINQFLQAMTKSWQQHNIVNTRTAYKQTTYRVGDDAWLLAINLAKYCRTRPNSWNTECKTLSFRAHHFGYGDGRTMHMDGLSLGVNVWNFCICVSRINGFRVRMRYVSKTPCCIACRSNFLNQYLLPKSTAPAGARSVCTVFSVDGDIWRSYFISLLERNFTQHIQNEWV